MSFLRHREIYPSDGGASPAANASAHRLDEFPAGYSLAGWSPPEPASASPAGHQYAVISPCRSRAFHRTVNRVLTVCVSRGGNSKLFLSFLKRRAFEGYYTSCQGLRELAYRGNSFYAESPGCASVAKTGSSG